MVSIERLIDDVNIEWHEPCFECLAIYGFWKKDPSLILVSFPFTADQGALTSRQHRIVFASSLRFPPGPLISHIRRCCILLMLLHCAWRQEVMALTSQPATSDQRVEGNTWCLPDTAKCRKKVEVRRESPPSQDALDPPAFMPTARTPVMSTSLRPPPALKRHPSPAAWLSACTQSRAPQHYVTKLHDCVSWYRPVYFVRRWRGELPRRLRSQWWTTIHSDI